uniref:Cell division cycle protein 26 homolog n=1 Tax=Heterorhabditis bacteriophora TaxID=37862 RepID=A0A1I7X0T2_HETBA
MAPPAPGPIRRRRFSTAKIQPTRIKKVMQSDEEIVLKEVPTPGRMGEFDPNAMRIQMQLMNEDKDRALMPPPALPFGRAKPVA